MLFSSLSSLTCSMLFFYNTIYATCFIFFSCKFSNDLHFSYLKFFITISPCLLISSIACKAKCTFYFILFLSFSKHNASESLLNSIGFLFVHLIFIWFFFNSSIFSFPYTIFILYFFFPKLVTHNVKSSRHYVLLVDMAIFFVPSGNGHVFESVDFFKKNYYCRLSEKPDIYILVNKIHGWQRYYNLHKCGQTKMKDFHWTCIYLRKVFKLSNIFKMLNFPEICKCNYFNDF